MRDDRLSRNTARLTGPPALEIELAEAAQRAAPDVPEDILTRLARHVRRLPLDGSLEARVEWLVDLVGWLREPAVLTLPSSALVSGRSQGARLWLLVAVLERATQHAAAIVPRARAEARDDAEALTLAVQYVADACFDERALTLLYWQEARNLSAQQRQRFEAVQRESIDEFARVLTAVRPELSPSAARMAVHAAASLMRSIATRPSSLDIDTQRRLITTMAMAALTAAQP